MAVPSASQPAFGRDDYNPAEDQLLASLDAERAVLGAVLVDPYAVDRVREVLPDATPFYGQAHRAIYRAVLALRGSNRPTDLTLVATYLQDEAMLDAAGGKAYLADLADSVVSTANCDEYAMLVRSKYVRRQLHQLGHWLCQEANITNRQLDESLSEGLRRYQEVMAGSLDPRGTENLESLAQITTRLSQNIDNGVVSTLRCGLHDLDRMLGEFHVNAPGEGRLITWAGRPAMGKSLSALDVAMRVANTGMPVLVFSYEMSKTELVSRLLVRAANGALNFAQARRPGQYGAQIWGAYQAAAAEISAAPLFIEEAAGRNVDYLVQKARLTQSRFGSLGLIVVDYLQLIEPSGRMDNIAHLKECTRKLKTLAAQCGCDIICLSQLNRGVESRTDKRPGLSDLRESGTIEQDSDIVVMCYRDEYYNPDTPKRGELELIVAKNRNGPVGTTVLLIEPSRFRLANTPH